MQSRLDRRPFTGSLANRLREPGTGTRLYWLGQAGFLLKTFRHTILIDPYLSDSLAEKYWGTALPHSRMMNPPIDVESLGAVDLVLCTHHHTDHMDPDTLAPLMRRLPKLQIVVPRASQAEALKRAGAGLDRLIQADAGDRIEPLPGIVIRPVRGAHETLQRDAAGHHVFLGYGIETAGVTIFHSGDTIPFEGQQSEVSALEADVALLPVNGRSAALAERNIAGNLFLEEAIALARNCAIPAMLAHHYGMFEFNTIEQAKIENEAVRQGLGIELQPAVIGMEYAIRIL